MRKGRALLLLCVLAVAGCSQGTPVAAPTTYREYEAPKSPPPTAWVFEGSSWAGPYRPAPPRPPPILTEEQAANKAKWELQEKNRKAFQELPEETQLVILSTDIVLGAELERRESTEHLDWHTWQSTKIRLRVGDILDGRNIKRGQEFDVILVGDVPAKPGKDGRTVFFFRQTECGRNVLAAIPESEQDIPQLVRLSNQREDLPLAKWAIHGTTELESELCAEVSQTNPPNL